MRMNNKGFTLVEILAVIVIIALIMAIAVPSALVISKKIRENSYKTKIEMIEKAAIDYGNKMIDTVKSSTGGCYFSEDINDNINEIFYNPVKELGNYSCMTITVEELAQNKDIEWDYKRQCDETGEQCEINSMTGEVTCTPASKCYINGVSQAEYYNKIVVNPVTDNIINKCLIYLYYDSNRVYAVFDKKTCDKATNGFNNSGKEYKRIK